MATSLPTSKGRAAYVTRSTFHLVQTSDGRDVEWEARVFGDDEDGCIARARRQLASYVETLLAVRQTGDRQIELSGCALDRSRRYRFAEWLFVTTPPAETAIGPLIAAVAQQIAAVAPLDLTLYRHPYLEGTPAP